MNNTFFEKLCRVQVFKKIFGFNVLYFFWVYGVNKEIMKVFT